MATEPITIFSHAVDPPGVLDALRQLTPNVAVVGPADNWTTATVLVSQGLFRRKPRRVVFTHDRDYYAGPDWAKQRDGMGGYFGRFPATDRTGRAMAVIASLRFAVSVKFEPEERVDPPDERLEFVAAVAKRLDGVWFRPSGLYDAAGRPLVHASGNGDPAAVFPAVPEEPEEVPAARPSADRVARRAMALAAVGARALLEQEADVDADQTRRRILAWVDDIGIGDELEPDEWKVLQTPVRKLLPRDSLNAGWRLEGLGVLAWALNRFALPPHDQLCDPGQLLPSVGLLNGERARAILSEPPLRPAGEVDDFRERQFAVHWRVRNFRLKPEAMDFAAFARTAWFGPLDVTGVRLVDNDLAIGDDAIAAAPKDRVQMAMSAAQERHLAVNWLHGDSAVYSATDTPT